MAASTSRINPPVGMLPPLGTTYASLAAFKLDVYEKCLKQSINLAIHQSVPDSQVSMGCSLAGTAVCSCGIECRLQRRTGTFEVTRSNNLHSCGGKERIEENKVKARTKIAGRLAKLKEEMSGEKGKGKARVQDTSDEEDDEEDKSDSGDGSSSEDEDSRRVTGGRWESLYPSGRGVQTESRQLSSIGPLSFPSPTDTFPSAHDLLVTLYACCSQRGFSIYRYGGTTTSTSALLLCSLAHDRCRHDPKGLCPFKVQIKEKNGRWSVTESELGHNHETRTTSGMKVPASKEGWKRESRVRQGKREVEESGSESEEEEEEDEEEAAEEKDEGGSDEEDEVAPRRRRHPAAAPATSAALRRTRQRSSLVHPRMLELKSDIDSLANGPPLSFPSSTNSSKSADYTSLRVQILAAARQRGFSMILDHRHCSQHEVEAGSFGLMCFKGHSRFGPAPQRCEMNLVIGKADDGSWRVLREEMEHNHELVGSSVRGRQKRASGDKLPRTSISADVAGSVSRPPPKKEKQARSRSPIPEPSTASARQHTHTHSPSPFPHSHQPPSPYAAKPSSFATAAASPPPTPFVAQAHPFYPTLLTFLRSINASPSLLPQAPLLLAPAPQGGGIDSTERLVMLLSLSLEMLEKFIDEELGEKRGLPRLQRALLKKAIVGARQKALGGDEAGGAESAEARLVDA